MARIENFDDMLPYVGSFGAFQKILFVISWFFPFIWVNAYFSQLFITLVPDHWCHVPELAIFPSPDARKNLSSPLEIREGEVRYSRCRMFDVNYTQVILEGSSPNASWSTTKCRQGWEYDFSFYPPSISTELDWVCEDDWIPAFTLCIYFLGAIVGTVLFGVLADILGRLPVLITANALGGCAGILTAFSQDFNGFVTCRFFFGMAYDAHYMMMYIILQEYVAANKRTIIAQLPVALFATLGNCTLPVVSYYIGNWRAFSIVTSVPMLLVTFGKWYIPESARWLLSKGKIDETLHILERIANFNKKEVTDDIFLKFRDTMERMTEDYDSSTTRTLFDLFKLPNMRKRIIILLTAWIIISNNFDCIVRLLPDTDVNKYVLWGVASTMTLPANFLCVLLFDKLGRRGYFFIILLACSFICFVIQLVPITYSMTLLVLTMLSRFTATAQWNSGVQYCLEILPTEVRGQGNALIHIIGHASSLISPSIIYLGSHSRAAAFLILSGQSAVCAFLMLLLPETTGEVLPQTLEDGETFAQSQKFFTFFCCQKKNKYIERTEIDMPEHRESCDVPELREACENLLHLQALDQHCSSDNPRGKECMLEVQSRRSVPEISVSAASTPEA